MTTRDFTFSPPLGGFGNTINIPSGSFVKPIEDRWVPKHILDDPYRQRQPNEIYCYTRFGIYPIPKDALEET